MKKKGLKVETYTGQFQAGEIFEKVKNREIELLYTTSNNHYVGIAPGNNENYIILDSLRGEPFAINQEEFEVRILSSLGREIANERSNLVGAILKKKFEINN